jgi:hypothetical protein
LTIDKNAPKAYITDNIAQAAESHNGRADNQYSSDAKTKVELAIRMP